MKFDIFGNEIKIGDLVLEPSATDWGYRAEFNLHCVKELVI